MPGIPKSRGCQSCKRRKIKCDENWPRCTPCRRSCVRCPGPSSVIKFVHNGNHATATDDQDQSSSSSPGGYGVAADDNNISSNTTAPPPSSGLEMVRKSSRSTDGGGWYGAFRLTDPNPSRQPTRGSALLPPGQRQFESSFSPRGGGVGGAGEQRQGASTEVPAREETSAGRNDYAHGQAAGGGSTGQFLMVDPALFGKQKER